MGQVTIEPATTLSNTGSASGGDVDASLSDESDATTWSGSGMQSFEVTMTNPTIPAGAVVKHILGLVRASRFAWGAGVPNIVLQMKPGGPYPDVQGVVSVPSTSIGNFYCGYGEYPYSQADLDAMTCFVINYAGADAALLLYELDVIVGYVTVPVTPVVTVGTADPVIDDTTPLISWTESVDSLGGKRTHFEVKVFDTATFSAGGFDPNTATPDVTSGIVSQENSAATGQWQMDSGLVNDTYRAYVRYGQTVHGQVHWSAWAFEGFVMNVPAPSAPTLLAVGDNARARNRITLTDSGGAVLGDRFEVQRAAPDGEYVALSALGELGPALWLPLGEDFNDRSPNERNAIGYDGASPTLTAGGQSGPFPGLEDEATNFDGANDLVFSGWKTLRNYVRNPRFNGGGTGSWATNVGPFLNGGAVLTAPGGGGPPGVAGPDGVSSYGQLVMGNAGLNFMGATDQLVGTFRSGVQYTAVLWIWQTVGTTGLNVIFGDNADPNLASLAITGAEFGWARYTVSWTPTANRTSAQLCLRNSAGVGASRTALFTAAVVYKGSFASYPGYFDGGQYAVPEATTPNTDGAMVYNTPSTGWTGTAHASASDWGPFANGTVRTFSGWAYRDTQATFQMLMTGNSANGVEPRLYLGPTANPTRVYFEPRQGGTAIFWDAWPGVNRWAHWALVFNEVANSVSLYINGTLASTQTLSEPYDPDMDGVNVAKDSPGSFPWDGRMAHFAIFERGLSAGEIRALYEGGVNEDAWAPVRTIEGDGEISVPSVVATAGTADTADTTSHSIALPIPSNGAIEPGDLLIIVSGRDGNSPVTVPTGWTTLQEAAGNGSAVRLWVAYKRAEGGESGNITVTSGGSEGGGWQILLIRGAHPTQPPEISAGVNSAGANPDPDAITPVGWTNENTLFIAGAVNDGNVAITAAPSGYYAQSVFNTRWANASGAGVATAYRRMTATADNPGAFTMSAEDSRAFTIAVRPARMVPVLYDWDAENGVAVSYRARAIHDYSGGSYAFSPWSTVDDATWFDTENWWLKHPTNPALNTAVTLRSQPSETRSSRQGIFQPLGSDLAVVVSDHRGSWQGEMAFKVETQEMRDRLEALMADNAPLKLDAPYGIEWDVRWLSFGDFTRERAFDNVHSTLTFESAPWREVRSPHGDLIAGSY